MSDERTKHSTKDSTGQRRYWAVSKPPKVVPITFDEIKKMFEKTIAEMRKLEDEEEE